MDPVQLQLMQQMGMMSSQMGLPGFYYPGVSGGVSSLSAFARDPNYGSPLRGGAYPDISPLAPLNLQNYGLLGTMASMAGNTYMTSMFQQNGILPMGNAGSFMQAQRANQYMQMQRSVAQEVAPQDADSYYQTIKGMAALTGQPFNREQREAARNLANTMAEFGPNIAMFRPDILDAIAGETGSVQAMASQMMEANRYRVDPYTGQIGYGKDANADLIKNLFDTLYSKDSMAQMNGLRAGEAGQLYRELADRGLITQEDGGLRERTITALEKARSSGRLAEIGDEAGVDVSGDLEKLNFEELDKLRQTSGVRKLLTDADVDNIRRQLRGYSDSIAAIREVFGENGNPNAPIPELIGALEALTSGQMHKFDAAKLNLMVRDMQSLSQMSGKSIDQMLAMNQGNTSYLQQMGLGNHAAVFAPDATNVGVAHGMAFAEQGGATGFGALNRAQAEQAASRMFARGMASEAGNMYATLGRINAAGGFDENTEAGRKLKAIHDAAVNGQSTYVDPTTGQETALPTRESEVRRLIGQGGAVGVGLEDFNIMLGQRTSNLRIQAEDKRYASIPMNLQAEELRRVSEKDAANVTYTAAPLQDLDPNTRNEAARRISTAARGALDTLSPQERQDRELRQSTMAEAVKREALNNGVTLTDAEASAMAENIYGSFENTAVNKFGFESETAASQVMGPQVTEARTQKMQQAKARSQMNQAMSELGPKGTITQRVFSAIQNQGERGKDADLDTFLIDMFGVENLEAREKIVPELQAIANEKQAIEKLSLQLEDPNLSAEERANTSREIEKRTEALRQRNIEIRDTAREFGFDSGEGKFGKDDVKEAEDAARNLEQLNRLDQARILSDDRPVSQAERDATADRLITQEDVIAIAERRRKLDIKQIGRLTAEDIETYSTKVEEIEKLQERLDTGGVDEGWFDFTGIDPDDREAMQEEIDRRKFELGGMTPELQQKYTELKRQGYDEKTAVRMIKDRLVQQVGTAEERAVEVADELGNVITTVGQLTQEDQDAVVRSRRADKAVVPTADQIAERAAELRSELGIAEEDLSTKDLYSQLENSNRFETGLRRVKEAVNQSVSQESSLEANRARTVGAVREALDDLTQDTTKGRAATVEQQVARVRELAEASDIALGDELRFTTQGGVPVTIDDRLVDFEALTSQELQQVYDAIAVKASADPESVTEQDTVIQDRAARALNQKMAEDSSVGLSAVQQNILADAFNSALTGASPEELADPERQRDVLFQALQELEQQGFELPEERKEELVRQVQQTISQQEREPTAFRDMVRSGLSDVQFGDLDQLTQEEQDQILQALESGITGLTTEELQDPERQREVLFQTIEELEQQGFELPEERKEELVKQVQQYIAESDREQPTFRDMVRSGLSDVQFGEVDQLTQEEQDQILQALESGITGFTSEELTDPERQKEVLFQAIEELEQQGFELPEERKEELVRQVQQTISQQDREPPAFRDLVRSGLSDVQFGEVDQLTQEEQDQIFEALESGITGLTTEELADPERQREVLFQAIEELEQQGFELPEERKEELVKQVQRYIAESEQEPTGTKLQAEEFRNVSRRDATALISNDASLSSLSTGQRQEVANNMTLAAQEALATLSDQDRQDEQLLQSTITEAVRNAASDSGVTLTENEAETIAKNIYGSFESTAVNKFGFDSESSANQALRQPKLDRPEFRDLVKSGLSDVQFGEVDQLTQEEQDQIFEALESGITGFTPEELQDPERQKEVLFQAIEELEQQGFELPEERKEELVKQVQQFVAESSREPPTFRDLVKSGLSDVQFGEVDQLTQEEQDQIFEALESGITGLTTEELQDPERQREVLFKAIQDLEQQGFELPEERKEELVKQVQQYISESDREQPTFRDLVRSGLSDVQFGEVDQLTQEEQDQIFEALESGISGFTSEELQDPERQKEVLFQAIEELEQQGFELPEERKEELVRQVQQYISESDREPPTFRDMVRSGLSDVQFGEVDQLTQEEQDQIFEALESGITGFTPEELADPERQREVLFKAIEELEQQGFELPEERKEELVRQVQEALDGGTSAVQVPTAENLLKAISQTQEGSELEPLTEEQQELIAESLDEVMQQVTPQELKSEEKRKEVITQAFEAAKKEGLDLQEEQETEVSERINQALKQAADDEKKVASRQKDLADDLSTEAVDTLLSLAPEELADKEDRITAVADSLVERAAERGVELSKEDATTYAEKALQEAERVAKEYGFDSLEDFVAKAPTAKTDALRKEIDRREELAGDQATLARSQLLAESQLQAMGQLAEGEKLNASAEEILKFKNMDEGLKKQLAEAGVEERHEIVAKWVDGRINEQFYGTEEQREESRQRAIRELQSSEGERRIEEIRDNFETMTDLRRELVLDPKAVNRLGAAKTEKAIKQSRDAEMKLQEMANRYGFNGSVEAMLASDFVGSDPEVIEQEFADLDQEQKQQVVERLAAEGITVKADELSVSDYQSYLRYQMKDQMNELEAANRTMRGATDDKERAKELGVTEKQVKPLEELARMEQTIAEDAEKAAETLGISEESYRNMVKGTEEFDESLKLFKGDDAAEQLAAAKKSEAVVADRQRQLDAVNENIQSIEESGGTVSATTLNRRKELEQEIATERQARDKRMRDAGLDPSKQEDVERYNTLLNAQGDVSTLETRRKKYAEEREKLKAEGLSEADIDSRIDQMVTADKEAQERLDEFRKQDITEADLQLAEAFGIDTSESNERLTEFKQMLKESGGTSEASKRTQKMLADTLEEVDKLKGLEGDTAIEKLDKLTDEYHAASPAERKALAHKYGIDEKDLDSMMRKTDFMGLENVDMSKMSDKEREKTVGESLKRTMGKDIEAEVKAEEERQLKLTGTVNVTGVIQGEGTFEDVTGNTVR